MLIERWQRTAALVLAILVAAVPLRADVARASTRSLAHSVEVVGSHSFTVAVSVPSDATIDLRPEEAGGVPRALTTTAGGYVGVVLAPIVTPKEPLGILLALPHQQGDGDVRQGVGYWREQDSLEDSGCATCPLPAGDYILNVIMSGPARLVLAVEELPGSVMLDGTLAQRSGARQSASPAQEGGASSVSMNGGSTFAGMFGFVVPETGILLDSYSFAVRAAPPIDVVGSNARSCRSVGDGPSTCSLPSLGATSTRHGTTVLTEGTVGPDGGISQTLDWAVHGSATWRIELSRLWVPLGG